MQKVIPLAASYTGVSIKRQLLIIGGFFFIFGFITWVNGTLIPYLRISFELVEWKSYLVTFAFYISYTCMALPSAKILQFTGMIKGMRIGLLIMVAGCCLFIPAALIHSYSVFLIGLFVVGIGLTLLQTAVNPYVTILGPEHTAAQRICMMGICNKVAGILAPLMFGFLLLNNADQLTTDLATMDSVLKEVKLREISRAVIVPYGVMAAILLVVSVLLKHAHLPEPSAMRNATNDSGKVNLTRSQISDLVMGFIAIFCAVGAEVVAADSIANYGIYLGFGVDTAKNFTSYTLLGMLAGYILGAWAIPKFINQERAFLYSGVMGIVFTILVIYIPGHTSVVFVALLGFANSMLWPAIWPQALKRLSGKLLNFGAAVLIMGIAGGALMPLLYGWAAYEINNQSAFWVLIPCYVFSICYWKRGELLKMRNK